MDGLHLARFTGKIKGVGDCWIWQAASSPSGYGVFAINGIPRRAHRVSYEHFIGPIPDGLQLDHLCRNRACVNPSHLEPVTARENLLRGEGVSAKAARTNVCQRGHSEWRLRPSGKRVCRACERLRDRGRLSGWERQRRKDAA